MWPWENPDTNDTFIMQPVSQGTGKIVEEEMERL